MILWYCRCRCRCFLLLLLMFLLFRSSLFLFFFLSHTHTHHIHITHTHTTSLSFSLSYLFFFSLQLICSTYLRASAYKQLKPHEKRTHKRFVARLFLYLLRSPVLDDFTMKKLEAVLGFVQHYIPLGTFIAASAHAHLNTLQQLHTYQWSS
eukprot:m.44311 g.44311  ORF g.44311 m.44311 type:complete len:151 (+) comp7162_c1_seq3:970-1422(+)